MRLSEQRRKATERDRRIRDYVEKRTDGKMTLDQLAGIFRCSRETVRKALGKK